MNSPQLARSFRWILFTLSLSLLPLPHVSAQNLQTLELKGSVERTLVPGETHTYRFYAGADQYLQFDLLGADMVVLSACQTALGKDSPYYWAGFVLQGEWK